MVQFLANGDIKASSVTTQTLPTHVVLRICANGALQAQSIDVANTGKILVCANGQLQYGISGSPVTGNVTFIADQVGEDSGFGAIVGLNGFLPETSDPISANSGNELIFFTKYQNTGLTIADDVGGTYDVLSQDVPLFGDELGAMFNGTAVGGSQTITVDNPNGGQVWEAFLYEFANVASITDVNITGTTVGGSGSGPITGVASTVPVGSMLVARVSSSATAQPVVDLGSGTQLGDFNTEKGVLIGWQGTGASITPACNGASGVEYTMIQMTLKNS